MVSFLYFDSYANFDANRFFGETLLLLSMFSKVNAETGWLDHNHLTECQKFINGLAIVSLVCLQILQVVCHRVSAAHSTSINGDANNDAGAFHNFFQKLHSVNDLWMASLILHAVWPSQSIGSKTQ